MTIRQAVPSDLPYLYEICHQTGYQGRDASSVGVGWRWMEREWLPTIREYYRGDPGSSLHGFELMLREIVRSKPQPPALAQNFPAQGRGTIFCRPGIV